MRITTFDLDEGSTCSVDVPLRRLPASSEPLTAASWRKLLDLVAHLQSDGFDHEIWGHVMLDDLLLQKPEPADPIREMQIKRFFDEWRAANPDPATWDDRLRREMRRRFPTTPGVQVSVQVDWRDNGPLRDGLPEMHYRFKIRRPGKTITEDARAKDVVEAKRIICETFGW